jgi:hypothetical protein
MGSGNYNKLFNNQSNSVNLENIDAGKKSLIEKYKAKYPNQSEDNIIKAMRKQGLL